jgi:hypothetical protein
MNWKRPKGARALRSRPHSRYLSTDNNQKGFSAIAPNFWQTAEKLRSEAVQATAQQTWKNRWSVPSAICLYHAAEYEGPWLVVISGCIEPFQCEFFQFLSICQIQLLLLSRKPDRSNSTTGRHILLRSKHLPSQCRADSVAAARRRPCETDEAKAQQQIFWHREGISSADHDDLILSDSLSAISDW